MTTFVLQYKTPSECWVDLKQVLSANDAHKEFKFYARRIGKHYPVRVVKRTENIVFGKTKPLPK